MQTRLLDSPKKRIIIALTAAAALVVICAGVLMLRPPEHPINGPKIIAAARAYTRALQQSHSPIQPTVPLQTLISRGFLKPADAGSLAGMDATIFLVAGNGHPSILMRVHLPDGNDLVLLDDGSVRQLKR
jgi:hypothetical protein